jgi:hypothetical protein
MKKIIYSLAIVAGIFVFSYAFVVSYKNITRFELFLYGLLTLFLLLFGIYGLIAEMLWKKFEAKGVVNFCVEANYYARKKGFFGRIFLFPFTKIKSKNSFVISFFGALTWVIILVIVLQAFLKVQS